MTGNLTADGKVKFGRVVGTKRFPQNSRELGSRTGSNLNLLPVIKP